MAIRDVIHDIHRVQEEIVELNEELSDLESCLMGAELEYNGHYAAVELVNANGVEIGLYVEEEDGTTYHVGLTFDELLELI